MDRRLPRDEDGLAPDRGLRMAVRPDPEVGYRRPGDHRRADGLVERRVFVQASPRDRLGDAPRSRPRPRRSSRSCGSDPPPRPGRRLRRRGRRAPVSACCARRPGSRASRPGLSRVSGCGSRAPGFDSEWSWRLEPVAGGTRVVHAATFEPYDRWTVILVRLGRASLAAGSRPTCGCSRSARRRPSARPPRRERRADRLDQVTPRSLCSVLTETSEQSTMTAVMTDGRERIRRGDGPGPGSATG